MELKVWVEGIQRIVCGVTETTTCQDVVFALAHATGKSGRFTLIERWRNNERQLAPQENPLKILMKWGEYSNDVQFILQWNKRPSVPQLNENVSSPEKTVKDNIGVVKGIPQVRPGALEVKESSPVNKEKKNNENGENKRLSQPAAPPPYRDPPPPTNKKTLQDLNKTEDEFQAKFQKLEESVLYDAQYRELISLVNYQREKLSSQQIDLTKYDAEIVFWEGKEREKQFQLDFITQEMTNVTTTTRTNAEQIQAFTHVEEEAELVRQQEKTLKSELTLLRSKLANCETELLQCKNKIRLLMDELTLEQRSQVRRSESRKQLERNLLVDMERIQNDIELAKQNTNLHHLTAETLKNEVAALEEAIVEKKKQVEHLVTEMKEANLESLSIAPQDELSHLFEGPNRAGSTRKMIGSPRQLENAVPTNKNPHGVWV